MFSVVFLKAALERALRSAAASVLSILVVGDGVLDAFNVDWQTAGGVALGAAVVSVLMSIAGQTATGNGPAFGNTETTDGI